VVFPQAVGHEKTNNQLNFLSKPTQQNTFHTYD